VAIEPSIPNRGEARRNRLDRRRLAKQERGGV
jgi:hypothetical protein